jgi:hypothetical protein
MQPPDEPATPEPTADFDDEAPETRPGCTGTDCFVKVPCRPGFATTIHIAPQSLFSPTNLGDSPLMVMFAGRRKPPRGHRDVLQEITITPSVTGPTLVPPQGTDAIFIGCAGSGSVTFRFSIGVA